MTSYREFRPPAALQGVVACLWRNDTLVHRPQVVVPDGCVDLVWLGPRGLVVAGADTGPVVWAPTGAPSSGVRLRAAAAGSVLGVPATEVLDQQVPLRLLWPEAATLEATMAEASPGERTRALARAVRLRSAQPDPLVAAAARLVGLPAARVSAVAAHLGVSERHLHRRVAAAVGYGPKTLARVSRLRRLVALAGQPLASRALSAGYASQAHMNDEVRRLTGATPVRFLEDAMVTAA